MISIGSVTSLFFASPVCFLPVLPFPVLLLFPVDLPRPSVLSARPRKKRTSGSKQEARFPPAAVFNAAGSLRASCLDAHARDSKSGPFVTATACGQDPSGF